MATVEDKAVWKGGNLPAEEGHEGQQLCGQGAHVQSHFHVQDVVGEEVVIEHSHPLGLLHCSGDGGGLLGDVRKEQSGDTGQSLRSVWSLLHHQSTGRCQSIGCWFGLHMSVRSAQERPQCC